MTCPVVAAISGCENIGRMTTETPSGRDVIAQFIPQSPFVLKLGIQKIQADQLSDDEVRLRLPWDPSNVTLGDMVHGGAIATLALALADVTVMAPARASDVIGVGRVLRRGGSLVNCEAEIVDRDGRLVAKALATYKVG
jgi:acyl-coenzyme A thioesterase PaaI-like protein